MNNTFSRLTAVLLWPMLILDPAWADLARVEPHVIDLTDREALADAAVMFPRQPLLSKPQHIKAGAERQASRAGEAEHPSQVGPMPSIRLINEENTAPARITDTAQAFQELGRKRKNGKAKVLIVCKMNENRSPAAQFLLNHGLTKAGLGDHISVLSRGRGRRSAPNIISRMIAWKFIRRHVRRLEKALQPNMFRGRLALKYWWPLRKRGIAWNEIWAFRSRQLTDQDIRTADIIFVAESDLNNFRIRPDQTVALLFPYESVPDPEQKEVTATQLIELLETKFVTPLINALQQGETGKPEARITMIDRSMPNINAPFLSPPNRGRKLAEVPSPVAIDSRIIRTAIYPGRINLKIFEWLPSLNRLHMVNASIFRLPLTIDLLRFKPDYSSASALGIPMDSYLGADALQKMQIVYSYWADQNHIPVPHHRNLFGSETSGPPQLGLESLLVPDLLRRGYSDIHIAEILQQPYPTYFIEFSNNKGAKREIIYHQTDLSQKTHFADPLELDLAAKDVDLIFAPPRGRGLFHNYQLPARFLNLKPGSFYATEEKPLSRWTKFGVTTIVLRRLLGGPFLKIVLIVSGSLMLNWKQMLLNLGILGISAALLGNIVHPIGVGHLTERCA